MGATVLVETPSGPGSARPTVEDGDCSATPSTPFGATGFGWVCPAIGGDAAPAPVAGGTPAFPPITPPVVGAFSNPEAGLSEGTVLTPAAFRAGSPVPAAPSPAGLIDPGAPPPTAPAGGPPPTLPAGAPPPTAALPMPAAPTPAPVAPAPVPPPPEPAPPPAPKAKLVGSAASNTANAKLLGLKRVIVCSIVGGSTKRGLPGSTKNRLGEMDGSKTHLTAFANALDHLDFPQRHITGPANGIERQAGAGLTAVASRPQASPPFSGRDWSAPMADYAATRNNRLQIRFRTIPRRRW